MGSLQDSNTVLALLSLRKAALDAAVRSTSSGRHPRKTSLFWKIVWSGSRKVPKMDAKNPFLDFSIFGSRNERVTYNKTCDLDIFITIFFAIGNG